MQYLGLASHSSEVAYFSYGLVVVLLFVLTLVRPTSQIDLSDQMQSRSEMLLSILCCGSRYRQNMRFFWQNAIVRCDEKLGFRFESPLKVQEADKDTCTRKTCNRALRNMSSVRSPVFVGVLLGPGLFFQRTCLVRDPSFSPCLKRYATT